MEKIGISQTNEAKNFNLTLIFTLLILVGATVRIYPIPGQALREPMAYEMLELFSVASKKV